MKHETWTGRTGGTDGMQRMLVAAFRYMSLRLLYGVMSIVVWFYMLFSRRSYRAMFRFFRRAFGHGRLHAFAMVYRNHYDFGRIILDRFAVYAGRRFKVEIEGNEHYLRIAESDKGAVFLSSHTGNFELSGYMLHSVKKRLNALVFAGESHTVQENRRRVWGGNNINMIPVTEDLSHIFTLSSALERGEIVCMAADRVFGSDKAVICRFLGGEARFPVGPFALALSRNAEVMTVFVMKESTYAYRVFVTPIPLPAEAEHRPRREQIAAMAQAFADNLETIVRRYPTQWFNYYDFWTT